MLKQALLCAWVASGCWVMAAQAQQFIYKWTDEQGQVRYSELPPPAGVTYETVRKPSGPASGGAQPAADLAKEQEELARKLAEEEAKTRAQQEQAQKDAEDRNARNCDIAKKNVEVLQSDKPVVKTDPKGNKVVLDAQQRQAELQRAQKDQDYFCNP